MRGVLRWTWTQTRRHFNRFLVGTGSVSVLFIVVSGFLTLPPNPTTTDRISNGLIALAVAIVVVLVVTFLYALLVAPYQQRNALRARVLDLEDAQATVPKDHMDAVKLVLEKMELPAALPLSVEDQILQEALQQHEPDSPLWADRAEYLKRTERQSADEAEIEATIGAEIDTRQLGPLGGAEGAFRSYYQALRRGEPVCDFGTWQTDGPDGLRLNNPFAKYFQFANVFPKDEEERARRKAALEEVWNLIPTLPVIARLRQEDADIQRLKAAIQRETAELAFRTTFTNPKCRLCGGRSAGG